MKFFYVRIQLNPRLNIAHKINGIVRKHCQEYDAIEGQERLGDVIHRKLNIYLGRQRLFT
jgi:hypothetical protein